jgi:putative ABC transport system permease protein
MYRIALTMLLGNRSKFLGILLGLTFAALLIVQQAGMFFGIMDNSFSTLQSMRAVDIWVMDSQSKFFDDLKPLLDKNLYRVRGITGVDWAVPYFRGTTTARLSDGRLQDVFLIGLDDTSLTGGPYRMIEGQLTDLRRSQGVVVDEVGASGKLAKPPSQPGGKPSPLVVGDTLEMNDRRAVVVGIVRGPRIWGDQPVVYTTYSRAVGYTPAQRRQLSYILAKSADGSDPSEVCRRITAATGLQAKTAGQFTEMTVLYLVFNTALAMTFGVSVFFGFLVGTAIAGQMFYNFTIENLRYFGTLKAMGMTNIGLVQMVFVQAAIVGFLGWGIGIGVASAAGWFLRDSELGFRLPWQLYLASLVSILSITFGAALLSLKQVVQLEPAIVFRE